MKKYTYTYRKRGLPNTPELTGEVEAENYFEARALAPKQVGEEYVILNVKKGDDEIDISELPETDRSRNTGS